MRVFDDSSRREAAIGALILLLIYVACMGGRYYSIDGMLIFHQARSMVYDHSLMFDPPFRWGAPNVTSRYGIGLTLLYLPGLLCFSWLEPYVHQPSAAAHDAARIYFDPVYTFGGAPVHILITVLAAYLVARFCRALGLGRAQALWGLAFYGLGSPALAYARGDFAQPLTGLCWIAALYSAFCFRSSARNRDLYLCSSAIFYAILTRPVEGVLLVPAVLLLVLPGLRASHGARAAGRAIAGIMLGSCLGVGVTLLVNYGRYGSPFTTGYEGWSWTHPILTGLAGLLISPGRGLLWAFPALLLLPLGVRSLWRSQRRLVVCACLGLALLQLLSAAAWPAWWGGWNWGPRLVVPALPLLALLAAAGAQHAWVRRLYLAPLALLAGFLMTLPGALTDILGGYGGTYSDTAANFRLDALPLLGGWSFLKRIVPVAPNDNGAIDTIWLRGAQSTHGLSLIVPLLLLAVAAWLALRLLRSVKAHGYAERQGLPLSSSRQQI